MNGSTLLAALVGPTAVGKTALSLDLAEALNAEILSCDSMQVYTSMDIGTAKPTVKERRGIPHHLIDLVPPTSEFSSADYKRLAVSCIKEVTGRGRLPLFCGGTGLYLDTVTRVSSLAPDIPAELRDELSKKDSDDLYDELLRIDPTAAAATHKNNRKRVIRAFELYYGTGKTKTDWDLLPKRSKTPTTPSFSVWISAAAIFSTAASTSALTKW
jgi:tRNA dimethylallyltransferase